MLHEFALDPEVLNSWERFRFFNDQFGAQYGRMISSFPKKWKKKVFEACVECKEVEKKRITEGLRNIDNKFMKRKGRTYEGSSDWLTNACEEHERREFWAIISRQNPDSASYILISDEIEENTPRWKIATGKKVNRKADILAETISPLLLCSKEIMFVDPYFDPDKARYRNCLKAFLKIFKDNEHSPDKVEYHTSLKMGTANYFLNTSLPKVQKLMPPDIEILIKRWEETGTGDVLHARYVLTEIGGMSVEHGLDEGNNPGETTDISLLDDDLCKERWKDYHEEDPSFKCSEGYSISRDRISKL